MSQRFSRLRCEGGSLPLALLVAIIVAGVVVVLIARTAAGQRQVQFDQAYHGALPAADAGSEIAKFRLNNEMTLTRVDGTTAQPDEFAIGESTLPETREADGRTYTWFMTRREGYWEVDSTSLDARGRRDVERRVLVELRDQPLVSTAAFADVAFAMSGSNTADSYTSDPAVADADAWCRGTGFVASNDEVTFSGVASPGACASVRPTGRTVDRVVLYDWANNPDPNADPDGPLPGGDRCGDATGNSVDPDHPNCREIDHTEGEFLAARLIDEPIQPTVGEDGDATAFISDALGECDTFLKDNGETLDDLDFRSSADPGTGLMPRGGNVLAPAPAGHPDMDEKDIALNLDGRFYCYDDVYLDEDTTIDAPDGLDDPVIIFVRGNLVMAGGNNQNQRVSVGCGTGGCTPGVSRPVAGRLWFFVLGEEVGIRAQSEFAGVVWAPGSDCGGIGPSGGGPNSQVDFYGSIICGTASGTGGWRFHYDEALADATDGQYVRSQWSEVPS